MENWQARTEMLLGSDAVETLSRARVAVFGVGGVGGYAVEALVRCGVGAIDIVDDDVVAPSNLNRQIIATVDMLGKPKVEVMAQRIASINPDCQVAAHRCFYLPSTAHLFDFSRYDYVVDAVDTVSAKLQLVEQAQACGTPIISSMGAANKLDPSAFRVADIYQTSVCPLAKVIRKECRKRGIRRLKVVYSTEPAVKSVAADADSAATGEPSSQGRRPMVGSVSFVPSVAGLIIAGEVVRDLISGTER